MYMADRSLPRYFDDEGKPFPEETGGLIETDDQGIVARSIDYLIETYLLSVCDSMFRVKGGGSRLACLFNNRRYENYYMVEKGIYRGTV